VGVFFGALVFFVLIASFQSFTVNSEISFGVDPIDFISLIINTILVVYVLRTLSRKDDSDKVERELLIGYFTKFDSEFSEGIHKMTTVDGVEGVEVAAFFKKYGMYLQELVDLSKSHQSKNLSNLSALEKAFSEIRELLSNTPQAGEIEDGVRIEGTRILYSSRHLGEITKSMGGFKKAMFNVVVGINRS
jgi:hypothetical protein